MGGQRRNFLGPPEGSCGLESGKGKKKEFRHER